MDHNEKRKNLYELELLDNGEFQLRWLIQNYYTNERVEAEKEGDALVTYTIFPHSSITALKQGDTTIMFEARGMRWILPKDKLRPSDTFVKAFTTLTTSPLRGLD